MRGSGVTGLQQMVDARLAVLGLRNKVELCQQPGVGFDHKTLYHWLNKGVDHMRVADLRRLAAALRLSPAVLLDEGPVIPEAVFRLPVAVTQEAGGVQASA